MHTPDETPAGITLTPEEAALVLGWHDSIRGNGGDMSLNESAIARRLSDLTDPWQ